MADNVVVTAGTGTTVAADEVVDATLGTVKVQYVKLMDGTLNGTTKATVDANGLDVDVTRLPALPAGTNNIGDVDVLTLSGQTLAFNTGAATAATLRVVIADDSQLPAVANNADAVAAAADLFNTATASYLYGYNGTTFDRLQVDAAKSLKVAVLPNTTGGLSTFYDDDLDETAVAVKAAAGGLFNVIVTNRTTDELYLHFWDVAQGSVTVGTTAVKFTLAIPGNASDHTMAMPNWNPHGVAFGTAITAACTTALNGTGAPAANACVITFFIK